MKKKCDFCGGIINKIIVVNSLVSESNGSFGECLRCQSLKVLEKINYEELYTNRNSSNYSSSRFFIAAKELFFSIGVLLQFFRWKKGKILDYGCGSGEFANALYKAGFSEVHACDLQSHRPSSLHQKIRYFQVKSIDTDQLYDVILLRHVLEHIVDPVNLLKLLSNNIGKSGKIIVEVPNNKAFFRKLMRQKWPGYFYPYHVYVFSEKGLKELANSSGLCVDKIEQCNTPIFGVFLMSFGLNRCPSRIASIFFYPFQCLIGVFANKESTRFILSKKV
jgi:SAM-dependent methyltransferase